MKTRIYSIAIWHADGIKNPYVGIWRYDSRRTYKQTVNYSEGRITSSSEKRLFAVLKDIVPAVRIGEDYVTVEYEIRK